jgi:hypothetical protein
LKRYQDSVLNQNGTPIPGVSIAVKVAATPVGSGADATLYSDDGVTALANPVTTDARGNFYFFTADGRYDIGWSGGSPAVAADWLADVEIADVLAQDTTSDTGWEVYNQTVRNNLNFGADVTLTRGAADRLDLATGDKIYAENVNERFYAHVYSGANMGLKIAAAMADADSAGGGIVDARGLFGAQTATTDPFSGITNACTLLLGDVTITCTDAWEPPANSNIIGFGPSRTVLTFSGSAGTFGNDACLYLAGSGLTELAALNANITAGTKTITLADTPAVSRGDVVVIYDATDSSYSGFRTYYRAGEYCLVDAVAGNNITTAEPIIDSYTDDANMHIYKLGGTSSTVQGIKVIGRGVTAPANTTDAIKLEYGFRAKVVDVEATSSEDVAVQIAKSFSSEVHRLKADKSTADVPSTSYALQIGNSQDINVTDSDLLSIRHAITVGNADGGLGSVVNRGIRIRNNRLRSLVAAAGTVPALNFHGNVELSVMEGNVTDGITTGGNKNRIVNNFIHDVTGMAIMTSELLGFDLDVIGNTYFGVRAPAGTRGLFVDVNGSLTANTTLGGTFHIAENHVRFGVGDGAGRLMVLDNAGSTAADLRINIHDNTFVGTKTSTGHVTGLFQRVTTGTDFERVDIRNNYFYAFPVDIRSAVRADISGNVSVDSGGVGISINHGSAGKPLDWKVQNNQVRGAQKTGIRVSGASGNNVTAALVSGNISTENAIVTAGSSDLDTGLTVFFMDTAQVTGNYLGGTQAQQDFPAAYKTITTLLEQSNYYYGTGAANYATITTRLTGPEPLRQQITFANGANSDVDVKGATFVRVGGPTGAFSITGFAGGANGRVIYLFNGVAQTLTITNEATSAAANQITTLTGGDVALRAGVSFATFVYDVGTSKWILVSANGDAGAL